MTVDELKAELAKHPGTMKIELEWSYLDCHCEDYCRCDYEQKRSYIESVQQTNRSEYLHRQELLKEPVLIIKAG